MTNTDITRKDFKVSTKLVTVLNEKKMEIVKNAIESFYYLIPNNSTVSLTEFISLVNKHSDNLRTKVIVEVLKEYHSTLVGFSTQN